MLMSDLVSVLSFDYSFSSIGWRGFVAISLIENFAYFSGYIMVSLYPTLS